MTLVLVTHDMIIASKAARNLQMMDGRIVFDGTPTHTP
jgi:predicted ABC-type transport system involved in lysophospholipase L1 biosynthesis ATPase subunit